jgi:hypothetical protein
MERHRDNEVERRLPWNCAAEERSQPAGERRHALVFEEVNQLSQSAFVFSVGVGCIEASQPATAESAQTLVIERRGVEERRPAASAEMFSGERLRLQQTGFTNGNSGEALKGRRADVARVRKDKRKHLGG